MASRNGRDTPLVWGQPIRLEASRSAPVSYPLMSSDHSDRLARPGIRPLRLDGLPHDVLCKIVSCLLPQGVSRRVVRGPVWTVGISYAGTNFFASKRDLFVLARTSRAMYRLATPYLYRVVFVQDVRSMLKLWMTLCRWCPANAAHIHHLLFAVKPDDMAVMSHAQRWASAQDLPVLDLRPRVQLPFDVAQRPVEMPREPFMWADGQPLLSNHFSCRAPSIAQRIHFDIIARSVSLLSLGILPPAHTNLQASYLFRQSVATVTSPTLLRPTQYLQNLQSITMQIDDHCRDYLFRYGTIAMPALERLKLVTDIACWFLLLHAQPHHDPRTTTILQKAHALHITRGHHPPPIVPPDLNLGLVALPNLRHLAIHPHPDVLFARRGRRARRPHHPAPGDLNLQLATHGRGLQSLDLSWILAYDSPAWLHLGPARCLTCLPALHNLVALNVSTQMLFGSLQRLHYRLRPSPGGGYGPNSSGPARREQALPAFLAALPASLQLLILDEHWDASELGFYNDDGDDDDGNDDNDNDDADAAAAAAAAAAADNADDQTTVRLATWHGNGDWMEARLADEQAMAAVAAARGGRGAAGAARRVIRARQETALLGLVQALCREWLGAGRIAAAARALVVRAARPGWFGRFVHPVVVEEEQERGVGLRWKLMGGEGREWGAVRYAFVEEVWLRGGLGGCY